MFSDIELRSCFPTKRGATEGREECAVGEGEGSETEDAWRILHHHTGAVHRMSDLQDNERK